MSQRRSPAPALLVTLLFVLSVGLARPALVNDAIVRAMLFYATTCPHCHQVITEDLPPLLEKYGDQLQIVGIDTTTSGGQALYQAAIQRFNIPAERLGVPTLIVGDVVLVGSLEIPQQFPSLIEKYLAQGGVDWPDIPGLAEALAAAQPTPTATLLPTPIISPMPTSTVAAPSATPSPAPTPMATAPGLILNIDPPADLSARLARDPAGNALTIVRADRYGVQRGACHGTSASADRSTHA